MVFFKKRIYCGNYKTWKEASSVSTGYVANHILKKVKSALLKVRSGEAVFERDSVLFDKFECSWPVFSILLKCYIEDNKRLSVLDFGGSLGSSYFQFRQLIPAEVDFEWSIIEQESFALEGKQTFADKKLNFFSNLTDLLLVRKPNFILISSVLAYLPNPFETLEELVTLKIPYLVIDRTFCLPKETILTVQNVPDSIYKASYPAWFLSQESLEKILSKFYNIISSFHALDGTVKISGQKAKSLGYICQLKS
jgi:putative methyltransferase (TIGR04325 family)